MGAVLCVSRGNNFKTMYITLKVDFLFSKVLLLPGANNGKGSLKYRYLDMVYIYVMIKGNSCGHISDITSQATLQALS